jgi:aspartate racemase
MLISSVNFAPLEQLQAEGKRDEIGTVLLHESQKLESAGVDVLAITSNTMHIPYDHISQTLSIPMIHIADATAQTIVADGHHRV